MLQSIFRPQTHKEKLFSGFFLYATLSFLMAVIGFTSFRELQELDKVLSRVGSLHRHAQHATKLGQDFLLKGSEDERFLQQGKSPLLQTHYQAVEVLLSELSEMRQDKGKWKQAFALELEQLDTLLLAYDDTYRELVLSMVYRGSGSHGLVGYLDTQAKALERALPSSVYYNLRLAEQAYLLHPDTLHLQALQQDLLTTDLLLAGKGEELQARLQRYRYTLSKLSDVHLKMGLKSSTGLSGHLQRQSMQVYQLVERLYQQAEARKEVLYGRLQLVVLAVVSVSVLLLAVLATSHALLIEREHNGSLVD